jgi:putative transposase
MADAYRVKDQHSAYFITLTVIDWVDVFSRKDYKDIVVDSLNYCIESKGLTVYEYVIMSNHMHAIVSCEHQDLSDVIRDFKKFTSKKIIAAIQKIDESRKEWLLRKFEYAGRRNSNNQLFQFWQQDYHAVELSSKKMWEQRTEYIHTNPVKAGLVDHPEEYVYGSARSYYNRKCLVNISSV